MAWWAPALGPPPQDTHYPPQGPSGYPQDNMIQMHKVLPSFINMCLIHLWFCGMCLVFCCLDGFFESFFLYCFEAHGRHAWERHSWRSTLQSNEGYGHETGWAQWHGTSTQSYGPTLSRYLSVCCSSYVFLSDCWSFALSDTLSLFLSLCRSFCCSVCVYLAFYLSVAVSVSFFLSICHSVCFFALVCHSLSFCLSFCLLFFISIVLYLLFCLSFVPPMCLCIFLSLFLSLYLSVILFYLSFCLFFCSVSHTLIYLWRPATISKLTATNRFSKRLWLRRINMSTARFIRFFISLYFWWKPTVFRKFWMSFSFHLACNFW